MLELGHCEHLFGKRTREALKETSVDLDFIVISLAQQTLQDTLEGLSSLSVATWTLLLHKIKPICVEYAKLMDIW